MTGALASSIRPYPPGDEAGLVALFAQVFGRPISAKWWRWKLKGRPALFTTSAAGVAAQALLRAAPDDLCAPCAPSGRGTAAPGSALEATLLAGKFRPAPGAFDFKVILLDPALDPATRARPGDWLLSGAISMWSSPRGGAG